MFFSFFLIVPIHYEQITNVIFFSESLNLVGIVCMLYFGQIYPCFVCLFPLKGYCFTLHFVFFPCEKTPFSLLNFYLFLNNRSLDKNWTTENYVSNSLHYLQKNNFWKRQIFVFSLSFAIYFLFRFRLEFKFLLKMYFIII